MLNMDNSILLKRLKELDIKLFAAADDVQKAANAKLSRIVEIFPHYTAHDLSHSMKTLEICEWLTGEDLINQLNAPELFVLFSSIFLHDVGMAISPLERELIKASNEYREFEKSAGLSPEESLAEWVRRDHHLRSAKLIRETYLSPEGVDIRDKGLAFATALICESHGERDLTDLAKYDPFYAWGTSGVTLRLPLLGILLRLSDLLHVTKDRTPLSVLPLVGLNNPKSKLEWAKHISTIGVAPIIEGVVRMNCICSDPGVHREILRLCDYINNEFNYCHRVLGLLSNVRNEAYPLIFKQVEPSVQSDGYEPWLDLTFKLNREGILRLITGERIYENPGSVVKELLMNAVDATRQSLALSGIVKAISVEFDIENRTLTVTDQGIGMDKVDLTDFLLDLGKCFYDSEEYKSRYQPKQRIHPLSEFGIGFASCFLVAEHVVLETLKSGHDPILLDMFDLMGFAAARRGTRTQTGTGVILHLKPEVVNQIEGATKSLESTCPHLEIPLNIIVNGEKREVFVQPFYYKPEELLHPFFKEREPNFIIEHRKFNPDTEGIDGAMSLLFYRKDRIMIPGGPSHFKLQKDLNRRISQLGFALPPVKDSSYFLSEVNNFALGYDLDFKSDMRLELDPSRTRILPSQKNKMILKKVDEYFVNFILDLHQKYWKSLSKERLCEVYTQLAGILRFPMAHGFVLFFNETLLPLIELG